MRDSILESTCGYLTHGNKSSQSVKFQNDCEIVLFSNILLLVPDAPFPHFDNHQFHIYSHGRSLLVVRDTFSREKIVIDLAVTPQNLQ